MACFESATTTFVQAVHASHCGIKVLMSIANTKKTINQGTETFAPFSRIINVVAKASGNIHSARVHLISVAVCKASAPYAAPAPTTDDVS